MDKKTQNVQEEYWICEFQMSYQNHLAFMSINSNFPGLLSVTCIFLNGFEKRDFAQGLSKL